MVFSVPFFRLPVPYNPNPEPLTYDRARAMIRQFTDDLAIAESTLAQVDDPSRAIAAGDWPDPPRSQW